MSEQKAVGGKQPWKAIIAAVVAISAVAGGVRLYMHQPEVQWKSQLEVVRDRFRDPESVKFRGVRSSSNGKHLCGQVDAKNGFGAYGGYKYFAVLDGSRIYIDDAKGENRTLILINCDH